MTSHMTATTLPEERLLRLMLRVDVTPGCWLWRGPVTRNGYAKTERAVHRVLWEHWNGAVPLGMQLDHLCRVRHCVNPDHLEVVSARENVIRGFGHAAINAAKTVCVRGHPFSGDNLAVKMSRGRAGRECLACRRLYISARTRQRQAARRLRASRLRCDDWYVLA